MGERQTGVDPRPYFWPNPLGSVLTREYISHILYEG
jgi:hypothetical protein